MPTHNGSTDQAKEHIKNDDRSSDSVLVTCPSRRIHDNACKSVGRRNETLRSANAEPQICVEDDREEVSECVGDCCRVEEDHGVSPIKYQNQPVQGQIAVWVLPNLPIQTGLEEFSDFKFGCRCITTVGIDPLDDPCAFLIGEEASVGTFAIGKIDQKPVACDGNAASDDSLHDENP